MATCVNHNRLAKNTIILYIRMTVVLIVQLYTSRVVLRELGDDNYGIWSVVATLIIAITFITNPLTSVTQRFLNIALAQEQHEKAENVFSTSFILFGILSLLLILLLETCGLWYLNTQMIMPIQSKSAANIVYQLTIVAFLINMLRVPYEGLVISYEKFDFFAVIGIIEVALRLSIVFLLPFFSKAQVLQVYAWLTLGVGSIIAIIYAINCHKNFPIARFKTKIDRPLFHEMMSFSGWSTFGAFASMTGTHGIALVLNLFFGVIANAALGIANQVGNAINQLVSNFQLAFRPQITKSYASGDLDVTFNLLNLSSKVSFVLIITLACPISFNINLILKQWLGSYPDYTASFTILILIAAVLEAISAPLWILIHATGRIKYYQIAISSLMLLIVVISWVLYKLGAPASTSLAVKGVISGLCIFVRIAFVKYLVGYKLSSLLSTFVARPCIAVFLAISCLYALKLIGLNEINYLFVSLTVFIPTFALITFFIVFSTYERMRIFNKIKHNLKL